MECKYNQKALRVPLVVTLFTIGIRNQRNGSTKNKSSQYKKYVIKGKKKSTGHLIPLSYIDPMKISQPQNKNPRDCFQTRIQNMTRIHVNQQMKNANKMKTKAAENRPLRPNPVSLRLRKKRNYYHYKRKINIVFTNCNQRFEL